MEVAWRRVAAYVLCLDEVGRILLTRFTAPGHPDHGKWTLPGGGMEWGETPVETAHRELLEETGLTADLGAIVGVFTRWFTADESAAGEAGHFTAIIFRAVEFRGVLRDEFVDGDTTDDARWFSVDDLDELPTVEQVQFVVELIAAQPG